MYFIIKLLTITLISLILALISVNNLFIIISTIEAIWVVLFSTIMIIGSIVNDPLIYSIGFFEIVIAACEIITIVSLYIIYIEK